MKVKNFIKIIIVLVLTGILAGCNTQNNIPNESSNSSVISIKDSTISIDELNIGNRKKIVVDNEYIYYVDSNNDFKLCKIDKDLKTKNVIYDKAVLEIISVIDDNIFFIDKIKNDDGRYTYNVCSIDKENFSSTVILNDVSFSVLVNNKLYYYKNSGELSGKPFNYELLNFCCYYLDKKEEHIIDEKIILAIPEVAYKNKIYYCGPNDKFVEYNLDKEAKRELNTSIGFSYRYSNDNIYSYKGSTIEKTNILDNTKSVVMPVNDKIYNIWEMNVTKEYIFFLAEETKEQKSDLNRLNLYRMKKDGSEFCKIYATDYTTSIIHATHLLYCIGDNLLLLYDFNFESYTINRNKIQVIDFDGNTIVSNF
ncbi:DUF5050 domain-containing protein [Sedimentibacter sp. zth1]|uniref:DUF5050 domain-containing protein n=1 Tax=Sedimentibacter sp. zth1 TaxID=2816908 RepID=UPI001A938E37|nr:DUF5050 domain-containing protein [Sedimentibacter sp. zth1]QSX06249.1 DUF5050 domain-containing protein [Sedimentibacter sp. zth1]